MKMAVPSFLRLMNGAKGSATWLCAVAVVASLGACSESPAPTTPTAGSTPTGGVGGAAGTSATAGLGSAAGMGAAGAGGTATFTAVLAILADSKNNCGLCHKMPTL